MVDIADDSHRITWISKVSMRLSKHSRYVYLDLALRLPRVIILS